MSDFPFLLVMIAVPAVGAAVVAALPKGRDLLAKQVALGVSLVVLLLAVLATVAFDPGGARFQLTTSVSWIPDFGVRFALGVDGIALVMLLLIGVLVPVVIGASWRERAARRPVDEGLLRLAAAARGDDGRRLRRHRRLPLLRLLRGDARPDVLPHRELRRPAPAVRGGEVLPLQPGRRADHAGRRHRPVRGEQQPARRRAPSPSTRCASSTSPRACRSCSSSASSSPSRSRRRWCRSTPGCPTPVPRRPIGGAVLLVGVLDKVGTFGFLRYCLPLFPDASRFFAPWVLVLAVAGILYAALLAMGQSDMKRLVSYTSISHFGFIALGIFAFTTEGGHRRGALHGQPRHRDRPAVPRRRHAHRPRRLAADPRLRRRGGARRRCWPGSSCSPASRRWRCRAPTASSASSSC